MSTPLPLPIVSYEIDRQARSVYHHYSIQDQARIDAYEAQTQETNGSTRFVMNEQGVSVELNQLKNPFILNYDQGEIARRIQQSSETLCRVTGASRGAVITIHDATAGLCREAVLMASCGANVTASERSFPLYLLAKDALRRAQIDLQLHFQESTFSQATTDVIYLDPMFPKSKKNAAVGREAVLLRVLAEQQQAQDDKDLLDWALEYARCRVVVKRPIKAPILAQTKPTSSVCGKAIRFDIYGKKKLPT